MKKNDSPADAKNRALHYIGYKPRTIAETKRKLSELQFEPSIIEQIICELIEDGILDDEKYAKAWIEERVQSKYLGKNKIKQELIAKGISQDIIEEALLFFENDDDEETRALQFLQRKYRNRLQTTEKEKLIQTLIRNGYSYAIAKKTANKIG